LWGVHDVSLKTKIAVYQATDRQTFTSTDNKGRLKLSAREPIILFDWHQKRAFDSCNICIAVKSEYVKNKCLEMLTSFFASYRILKNMIAIEVFTKHDKVMSNAAL